jgi:DNA-binding CsgD family transcriptional regulator
VVQTLPVRSELPLAFAGLADLLERHLELVIGQLPAPQAEALRVALLLAQAPPQPPEPRVIAAGFRSAVGALARTRPVLLVIDDVQWLDRPSQAAVGFTVRRPMPTERARTLLALGAVLRRLKQRGSARGALAEALELSEAAGARLWTERAGAEQARVSGRAPGPRELTETEQRVAALVASGLTNRQVAAELFVTVRAVESTLTKAYAKLGIQSRTQLAARLHHDS